MKKSEFRLIIFAVASLVLAVLLGVATIIAFFANTAAAADSGKFDESFNSVRQSIESVTEDFTKA